MSEITGPNEALPPAIPLDEAPGMPPPLASYDTQPPMANLRPVPFEDTEAFQGF